MEAIYPGSFDPITLGHVDLIERSSRIFERLHVVVAINPNKNFLFTPDERLFLVKESLKHLENVEFHFHEGLIVDFLKKNNIRIIIRGLRVISDFEYELQMAHFNHKLNRDIETIFLMTSSKYSFINSTMVKQIASFGGCIKEFVPEIVDKALRLKYKDKNINIIKELSKSDK